MNFGKRENKEAKKFAREVMTNRKELERLETIKDSERFKILDAVINNMIKQYAEDLQEKIESSLKKSVPVINPEIGNMVEMLNYELDFHIRDIDVPSGQLMQQLKLNKKIVPDYLKTTSVIKGLELQIVATENLRLENKEIKLNKYLIYHTFFALIEHNKQQGSIQLIINALSDIGGWGLAHHKQVQSRNQFKVATESKKNLKKKVDAFTKELENGLRE